MINFVNLMMNYFAVCGPEYFCGNISEILKIDRYVIPQYTHLSLCPNCSCDYGCISRGNCCPDFYFSLPTLSCVNRTIIEANNDTERSKQNKRLMVKSCQRENDEEHQVKCAADDIKSRVLYQPVTDVITDITYANKFCALCNDVKNYTEWNIDIDCAEFADFNFLSTIDEIIDYAFEKKCIIQSVDENVITNNTFNSEICMIMDDRYNITKCNVTGAWDTYDSDIEEACKSDFYGYFRHFKNIFCFMCNPSLIKSEKHVTSCNETGMWILGDDNLQHLCNSIPSSPYTNPFNNVFCNLCNRQTDKSDPFIDIHGDMNESQVFDIYENILYRYSINVTSFSTEFLRHRLDAKIKENPSLLSRKRTKNVYEVKTDDSRIINISSLFRYYVSQFGSAPLCPSRASVIPKVYTTQCTCDPHCVFINSSHTILPKTFCCIDARLDFPATCIGEFDLSKASEKKERDKTGYMVVNGCFQERSVDLYDKECKRRNMKDIFSVLPLSMDREILNSSIDVQVSYENVYCALCNLFSTEYIEKLNDLEEKPVKLLDIEDHLNMFDKRNYYSWNLDVVCQTFLPTQFNVEIGDVMDIAHRMNCLIRFDTKVLKSSYCNYKTNNRIVDCAKISNWTFIDKDVEWACLNTSTFSHTYSINMSPVHTNAWDLSKTPNYRSSTRLFKNSFCSICKPEFPLSDGVLVDSCNATGQMDSYRSFHEHACSDLVQTFYHYPFKNQFCALCNEIGVSAQSGKVDDPAYPDYERIPGLNWFPILRNMFSIDQPPETSNHIKQERCSDGEIYDRLKIGCMKIRCFPGKLRMNDTCLPLLKLTKKLHYTLSFEVNVSRVSRSSKVDELMFSLRKEFDKSLSTALRINGSSVRSFRVLTQHDCNEGIEYNSSVSFVVLMTLFIEENVIRQNIEKILFQKINMSMHAGMSIVTYPIYVEESQLQLLQPGNCFHFEMFDKSTWDNAERYKQIPVTMILFCPYVILHDSEFSFNESSTSTVLIRNGRSLKYGSYQVQSNSTLAVCIEELTLKGFFNYSHSVEHAFFPYTSPKSLWYVQIACNSVSCVCLSTAIIMYLLFPHLRTIPGVINMITFSTLLIAIIFSQSGYTMAGSEIGCSIFGMCLHYSWLCVFTTMGMCNFHMNGVFRSKCLSSCSSNSNRILLWYNLFSFGVPLLLVLSNILYAHLTSSPTLGYGGTKCFILDRRMLIATFMVPITLTVLVNVILFISTSVAICNTPSPQCNQGERHDFCIVLRIASVTGIIWIFQVIDIFYKLSYFSYFSTVLTSLQGFFVFLAFFVNERMYQLAKNSLYSKIRGKLSFTKSQTYTMNINCSDKD